MKLFKVPKFARFIYSKRVWGFSLNENSVYLTFDDGPHPDITPFVLDELKKYNAQATFFCVGSNVEKYPELFQRILHEGHQVGNHTFAHENATKVSFSSYKNSIEKASNYIESNLFRPPYGRLNMIKAREIAKKYRIIMWSWLSYDFDRNVSIPTILQRLEKDVEAGSILVLHDNAKISDRQKILLPQILKILSLKGFCFSKIDLI